VLKENIWGFIYNKLESIDGNGKEESEVEDEMKLKV